MKSSILMSAIALSLIPRLFLAPDNDDSGGTGSGETETQPTGPLSASDFLAAHPIVETAYIEIKKIVIDAGTQPRVVIDNDVVAEYVEVVKISIKDEQPNPFDELPDDKLPQVFRDPTGRCVLADGFHRFGGHKGGHAKEMKCAIRNGTERDALMFSLGTNQDHGVRRSNRDKVRAVKLAFGMPESGTWPNTEIARLCGVSEAMVREHKPAKVAAAPAVKNVKIRGKVTKMDTAAIGKGKGGGKKAAAEAKKAEKVAKKNGTEAPTKSTHPAADAAKELDEMLKKIATNVGGEAGGKIRTAVQDGSLALSKNDVKDFAGFDPKMAKRVAPLVTGGMRMKPAKAFDFITSELPEKIVTELENRAIADLGKFEWENDSITIVVKRKK